MVYVVIAFFFGLAGGVVGRIKGSSFLLWFVISAILPFVGLLAAVFMRMESDEPRRMCPGCGKVLKAYEALCLRCGTELSYPSEDELLPSEAAVAQR